MRREWCRVAFFWRADVEKQHRTQSRHQMRGDDVGFLLAAADPLPQMIDIKAVCHGWLAALR